ncbi:hypothetical protein NQ016_03940 [Staphylococcus hyicus]|uniref:hypothetical protein n=1 Tax=Staphylococcus hyicus TaxID=1284 RepID=UPI00211CDDC9|nr:hypothetical protein [Staphylococcus hyicus]MCQ9290669.1 hypothetical protein [Staphylococcus hyicus]MCQ9305911.1 hypothetical protein [Staphylococcus hyicus]MCQ9308323.1 hypothetical protein [Staphylococcus hyicus]MCQ9310745.1 hypothetical protein [Staphylococcus hyicus]
MNKLVKSLEIEMIREKSQTANGLKFLLENYSINNAGLSTIKVFSYSGIKRVSELSNDVSESKVIKFICNALFSEIELFESKYGLRYSTIIFEVMDLLTNAYKNAKFSNNELKMIDKIFDYKQHLISEGEF